MTRISRKTAEIAGVQDKIASNDSVAMGVGMVLFWPALFFIDNEDKRVELGELKGRCEAIEQVAIQKKCDISNELAEARKIEEERLKKEKQEQEKAKSSKTQNERR